MDVIVCKLCLSKVASQKKRLESQDRRIVVQE